MTANSSNSSNSSVDKLTDQALLNEFGDLVQQDRDRTASLLRHIDAIDRRKLWARKGHPSMFEFLVARCHMSESTAGKRIGAARTARRFPGLFTMVARGEIHLSGIHRLKAHLTPENHEQVLAALLKLRDKRGTVIGLAAEQAVVDAASDVMQGRLMTSTTWTLTIPDRGTIFLEQAENQSEFARKAVLPALAIGKAWDEPWSFVSTVGPAPDGRGRVGGYG